ncbi:Golgi SNAP receptor complex member 1-like [Oppia nitens]|uniref:Golgi SNAP receptor complex member 1-like n=1 Tax=Oppia nitens TaxID=1686743 RepID=UPI0023DC4AAF|nr:Golgi SNAP receptor complex member 1-like [Oppia nitens]
MNDINGRQTANQWEDLRRQARHYENELDSKLLSFSKLVSKDIYRDDDEESDTTPLMTDSKDNFERLNTEIDALLRALNDVNTQMSQYCERVQNASATIYTLQRHREILSDYSNEFNKTRNNIEAKLNRELLLGPHKKDTGFRTTTNKKNDLLLKENQHIRSSEIMIDEQINVAVRTRDHLINQRNTFKSFQTQMTTLANKFPIINSLVHRINVKKRKDSIILGIVIAVCMTFLILYIF